MEQNLEELLAFYALGTLTEPERAQVEAYVASNPDAKARLAEMVRTASALPRAVEPMQPSAALKAKVVDRVRADAASRPAAAKPAAAREHGAARSERASGARLAYAFAVFSLLVAVGVGLWGLSIRNQVTRLQTQVAALEQEVQGQRTVLAALSSPNAQAFAISGTDNQPQAQGHLIANSRTGSAVLVVSGLKPLAAGSTYEFWLLNDSAAVPAGLFKVNEAGAAVLQVTQGVGANAYNAIGVSIEPAGGSQKPTGDIVMLGKLN